MRLVAALIIALLTACASPDAGSGDGDASGSDVAADGDVSPVDATEDPGEGDATDASGASDADDGGLEDGGEDTADAVASDVASDVPPDSTADTATDVADTSTDAADTSTNVADAADTATDAADTAVDAADTSTDVADADGGADADVTDPDAGPVDPIDHAVVFAGNSYTAYNGLATNYESAATTAGGDRFASVSTRAVTPGGYRLVQHAADAANPSSNLGRWLAPGDDALPLTHLVLQEQSQIPGFPPGQFDYEQSQTAAVELAGRADALGATTVLYMTWGRRTGDDRNPDLYPDYTTMQDRLEAGYRAMAAGIEAAGYEVEIAPVGPAFREVYRTVEATGADPATPGTAFWDLYSGDGSHPSAEGTWLAIQVMLGVVADLRLPAIPLVPAGVSGDRAEDLRAAAWTAIEAERAR